MSGHEISDQVNAFLKSKFPGSSIDHGYDFVAIYSKNARRINADEAIAPLLERLAARPTWLVAVNIDPALITSIRENEHRTVTYSPDWNVHEDFTEYLAEIRDPIDIQAMRRSLRSPGALALIEPTRELVFDAASGWIYATNDESLRSLLGGLEQWLDPASTERSQ